MDNKKNQVLVAMDFSESASNALCMACEFAKIHDAEVVLLTVVETGGGWFGKSNGKSATREELESKMETLLKSCDTRGRIVVPMFKEGNPTKVILDTAEELNVELVLMGTHGWPNSVGGKMLGTMGNKVIRTAPCPVVTVKDIKENQQLKKILIPVYPEFGIREIRNLLADFDGKYEDKIELISVVPTDWEDNDDEYQGWVRFLRKQHKALTELGFEHIEIKVVKSNDVSKAISSYAESHDNEIDLIMMETHGRTGLDRMISGSVTEAVINHTHLPVLSLRPVREEKGRRYAPSGY